MVKTTWTLRNTFIWFLDNGEYQIEGMTGFKSLKDAKNAIRRRVK